MALLKLKEIKNLFFLVISYTGKNVFISLVNDDGDVFFSLSSGQLEGFNKKKQRISYDATLLLGKVCSFFLREKSIIDIFVKFKGKFPREKVRHMLIGFEYYDLIVFGFKDLKGVAHNGVKKKKKKRK